VALSLSANDYVGHVFGPDSWEAWDHLLRLDAALGRFFDDLDRRVGADGWAALLTADHGIAPVPEQVNASRAWCTGPRDPYGRPCVPTTRIDPNAVARAAQQAAVAALGPGDWVSGVADPYLYLSKRGATLYPESRERLVSAIAAGIRKKFPDIVRAVDVVQMARSCPRRPGSDGQGDDPRFDLSEDGLLCASFGDEGVPAIYLVTARGSFFDALYTFGAGASHGSPYPFDRAVPLLVRAPGRVGAGRVVAEPVPFTAFAHTVARLLGVPSPADAAPGPSFAAP
jgi:arylsulfatase A-like enzyme